MCNTGKISRLSSCLKILGKSSTTFTVFMFPLLYVQGLGIFSFPPLTVRKKIPLKVSPLCSPHQVKAPDDLHQGLGQGYCLKTSSEFHLHCAFPLFLSMTYTSWPRRTASTCATMPQMNSSGTSGQASASWLHCPRRVSCLLQLDELQKNGWQHLHWWHRACMNLGLLK